MKDLLLKLYVKAQIALREERAQDMVEYALVVGIIAVGAVAAMQGVAGKISDMFTTLGTAIDTAAGKI
jgi:pilus assembly protein Flp/PilA